MPRPAAGDPAAARAGGAARGRRRGRPDLGGGSGTVAEELEDLVVRTTGRRREVDLVGWVHNDVPHPDATYAWPAPNAYFTVWHCPVEDEVEDETAAAGRWLPASEAAEHLAHRHWWPLLLHLWQLPGSAGRH